MKPYSYSFWVVHLSKEETNLRSTTIAEREKQMERKKSAYLPPHKRLSHNSSSSSSSSSPSPTPHRLRDRNFLPQLNILWSNGAIRRFLVLPNIDNQPSDVAVEFARFHGKSFAHLQDDVLYTLRLAAFPAVADPSEELERLDINRNSEQNEAQNVQRPPWLSVVASLREDFCRALGQLKDYLEIHTVNRVAPKMCLRFGRVLFHHRPNKSFHRTPMECQGTLTPQMLEKAWADRSLGADVRKTFDNSVAIEFFTSLKQIALKEAWKSAVKERYLVEIEDEERPNVKLVCICCVATDGRSGNSSTRLIIQKVKLSPVRHMVADVACIGKKSDLRLILVTMERLIDLPTEEKQDLDKIISRASIDANVKGGVHWPVSSSDSTSNRFKVVGVWHMKKRLLMGENAKWKFVHANRTEFKASSGRLSYEVEVNIWKDYLNSRREWNQEEMLSFVEVLIEWIWKKCL